MKPNSLLAESSIHFLPSGGWALGTPVSKSEKSKLTKITGVLQRSIPMAQYSYSVLWPQPGHRNISLPSAHSSWPTEQSFPTTTKRTQMLHVENDPGFDSKKSKRGWGWRRNKTSCKKFISEAGWWKHQACCISLLSASKKENTEAMWT